MYIPPTGSASETLDYKNQNLIPFMNLAVGGLQVKDTFDLNVTGSDTEILDGEVYEQFSRKVLNDKELQLGIKSEPQLEIGSLRYRVNFQKTLQVKGLNGLKGITISNSTILERPMEDGTNMVAIGVIPNPSSFILEIHHVGHSFSVDTEHQYYFDLYFSCIQWQACHLVGKAAARLITNICYDEPEDGLDDSYITNPQHTNPRHTNFQHITFRRTDTNKCLGSD
ncbi:hypothetical protein ABW20_dc0109786 [Dactylellina cionopaga]|nr:hypothetical protein ABW20_dc0109786 [Dactylellina cionopaga]